MNRASVGLLTSTHIINDLYSGAVPALLPFLVAERHYSYAAISVVALAATLLSSVVQPVFGVLTDRHHMWWLVAVGMFLAALGVGFSGLSSNYVITCLAVSLSGFGVAAYHPEATRLARVAAGASARGMSVFSVGGNVGIALAPPVVAFVLSRYGVRATPLLVAPALLMVLIYVVAVNPRLVKRRGYGLSHATGLKAVKPPRDNWPAFRVLLGVVIARSIGSSGINTFIALFIIGAFGRSASFGANALTAFSGAGIAGTLAGGWLADRIGRTLTLRAAYMAAPVILTSVIISPNLGMTIGGIIALGFVSFVPFSVQVTLGQEYLPNRLGTASGVTLGLGITAGGVFVPVLGVVADSWGISYALWVVVAVLLVALALSTRLREPSALASDPPLPEPSPDLPGLGPLMWG